MIVTSRSRPRRRVLVSSVLLLSLVPSAAAAGPTAEERAVADALFQEGKRLLDTGKTEEACSKLEESHRLDPQGGTLLNLAVCHEAEGRLATALLELQEAYEMAVTAQRRDRVEFALQRMEALRPRVPRFTAEVPERARLDGLELRRNGTVIPSAAWNTSIPVDPGQHTLVASAPGARSWRSTIRIDVGETATVTVPRLAPHAAALQDDAREPDVAPEREAPSTDREDTVGYAMLGAGVAGLGTGIFYGLRAFSKATQRDEHCDGDVCDERGVALDEQGARAATIANLGFGVAIVGLGVGSVLLLTGDRSSGADARDDAKSLRLSPVAGRRGAGFAMEGTW